MSDCLRFLEQLSQFLPLLHVHAYNKDIQKIHYDLLQHDIAGNVFAIDQNIASETKFDICNPQKKN